MLTALSVIIYGLVVLISLLLIALILVQPSKSGGFGSAFGGLGESVFGAQAMGHLSKLTVVFISLFFVLTLLLAVISGHIASSSGTSVISDEKVEPVAEASAAKNIETAKDAVPGTEASAAENIETVKDAVSEEKKKTEK